MAKLLKKRKHESGIVSKKVIDEGEAASEEDNEEEEDVQEDEYGDEFVDSI
jgi:hypothetical protein